MIHEKNKIDLEILITDNVSIPGLQVETFSGLYDRYADSALGKLHAAQVLRYSSYGYDSEQMLRDLGPDVHPVERGKHTHDEILLPLIYAQNYLEDGLSSPTFTPEEIIALRISAYIHDFGENEAQEIVDTIGAVTGDIQYGNKSEQDEKLESEIRNYIRSAFYPDIPDNSWDRIETIISNSSDGLDARAFELTEHIGYYATGLRAGYLALLECRNRNSGISKRDDESYYNLMNMGLQVTDKHRESKIPGMTADFPYGAIVLDATTTLYQYIHSELKIAN